jgi:hypothetical protein
MAYIAIRAMADRISWSCGIIGAGGGN